MKKVFRKNIKIFLGVASIVLLTTIYFYRIIILEYLGENIFLRWHNQNISSHILEFEKKIDNREPVEKFSVYYLLGRIYFVNGDLGQSIENYTSAIGLNPSWKESYYGRGLSYGFLNPIFYTNAKDDFKRYIELDNIEFEKTGQHAYGAWAGYNDLAWIYFLEGDFVNAELTTRAGLEISQTNPWLSNMLGVSLLAQKKCSEAKEHFVEAKKILEKINSEKFGEAYSGDSPDFWTIGKEQMKEVIDENIKTCEK